MKHVNSASLNNVNKYSSFAEGATYVHRFGGSLAAVKSTESFSSSVYESLAALAIHPIAPTTNIAAMETFRPVLICRCDRQTVYIESNRMENEDVMSIAPCEIYQAFIGTQVPSTEGSTIFCLGVQMNKLLKKTAM